MCGITGFSGQFSNELLTTMSERIAHRGPDADGEFVAGAGRQRYGLGHRRLAIVDLSPAGRQPMTVQCANCDCTHDQSPEHRLWLAFNGEIYNYPELRRQLEAMGHTFVSRTDSEVLLHLYAEYGPDFLKRLNGIFALAIYDGRQQPAQLLLARDGLGVKPLYYAETPDGFLFSSEMKSLLAYPGLSREIDLAGMSQYVTYLWSCAPATPLKSVRKFRSGEAMIVRHGSVINRWQFYDLPFGEPLLTDSEPEIALGLEHQVEQAVQRQLMSDVQIGAFLSGGLDSSAIVACMHRLTGERVPCYTLDSGGGENGNPDDLPYARLVAQHVNADLHEVSIRPSIVDELPEMIYLLDEPQGDLAPLSVLLISQAARADGLKVMMSGAGGDDLFTGYRRHTALGIEPWLRHVPGWLASSVATLARHAAAGGLGSSLMGNSRARRLIKLAATIDRSPSQRMMTHFHWGSELLGQQLFAPDARRELADVWANEPLSGTLAATQQRDADPIHQMLSLELRHFLADHNLNFTDKAGMASGVEIRVPLLDLELVNFACRIPSRFKQQGLQGKAILRKAMERLLPHEVIYRRKSGFGVPLSSWLAGELRGYVREILSPARLEARGLFDPATVSRMITLNEQRRVDCSYVILSLICVELWCERFLDQGAVATHRSLATPPALIQLRESALSGRLSYPSKQLLDDPLAAPPEHARPPVAA